MAHQQAAPLREFRGHGDSVICLAPSQFESNTLASGGEDGWLVLHDFRAPAPCAVVASAADSFARAADADADARTVGDGGGGIGRRRLADADARIVAAVAWCPRRPEILYAAAGTGVVALDVRALKASASAAAAAAGGPAAWNPLARSSPADAARDNVAALDTSGGAGGGGLLAAADDAGDVAVFDLLRGEAAPPAAGRQPQHLHLKRRVLLRNAHGDAPCCAVAFAPPPLAGGGGGGGSGGGGDGNQQRRRTVAVLSGGCDSRVALGDTGLLRDDPGGGSRRPPRLVRRWEMGGEAELASGAEVGGPRLCNPPFVLGMSTTAAVDGHGRETVVAAVARGDGVVAVFAELFADDGGGGGGSGGGGGGGGGGDHPSVRIDAHRRAASCARFVRVAAPLEGQVLMLATGGDDGRVCLWYWGPEGRPAARAPRPSPRHPPSPLAFEPALHWQASMPRRGAKVNAIVDVVSGPTGVLLAVADTERTVKAYDPMGV